MVKVKKEKEKNVQLWRFVVMIETAIAILSLHYTYASLSEPFEPGTQKFVYENIGVGLLIAYIIFGLFMSLRFQAYWPLMSKKEKSQLDERQLRVRQRVYERSYRIFALSVILAIVIFSNSDNRMVNMLWWLASASYLFVPTLVAAWQKDS